MNVFKRIIFALLAFVIVVGIFDISKVNSSAASGKNSAVVMYTTSECSVWSAPATKDANRVKKVPVGYKVTVYPTVVKSSARDGKTFYKTVKGSYILCKCLSTTPVTTSGNSQVIPEGTQTDVYSKENIQSIINGFKGKYPEGMLFTDATNSYIWTPESRIYRVGIYSSLHGTGCVAFAMEVSDAIFGTTPISEYTDVSKIKVGDIIRINNDRHSVIIYDISADGTVTVAEANYSQKVHYGRSFSAKDFASRFCYGWTRY